MSQKKYSNLSLFKMKKQYLFLILLLGFFQAKAQTTSVLSESFENGAKTWTVASTCSDNTTWGYTTAGASDGTYSMTYGGYTSGCSGFLISPALTINSYKASDSLYMTFDFYRETSDPTSADYMSVSIVSADGNYTNLQGPFEIDRLYNGSPTTSKTGWVTYHGQWAVSDVLDANNQFKLVFAGVSMGNGDYMYLDNVKLDMGVKTSTNTVKLTYINPKGSVYVYYGEKYTARWTSTSTDNMKYKVVSTDGTTTIASGTGHMDDDSFVFTVPTTSKSDFEVVITDLATNDVFTSDNFQVVKPFTLLSPSGGETFYWGQSSTVTWTSSGMGTIDLFLKASDGTTINSWTSASYNDQKTIIIPPTTKTTVYLDAIDEVTGQEVITPSFTIAKPMLNFISPTAGQTYMNDNTMAIQWSSNGIGDVKPNATINLQLVDTTGALIQAIASNVSYSAGTYSWPVPRIFGTFQVQASFNDSAISQTLKYNSGKVTLQHNTGLLENAQEADMNVYPNPSNGAFTIQLKDAMAELGMMTIYSIDGKQIMQQEVGRGEKYIHANLDNLNGMYTVYIRTSNSVMHTQIMLNSGK
jgi:hypothetical protein